MNKYTCYFYHRTDRYNVTIAYEHVNGGVRYGAAFCRPEDQFHKRRGREIARGRMQLVSEAIDVQSAWEELDVARWQVHETILNSMSNGTYGYIPENFKV